MFTFISITYNHEKFIIMHLESMKYQIQNFFGNIKVSLIIADDGSSDKTIELCKKWIDVNRSLFDKILILGDGINRGTCQNFCKALQYLESEDFFLLAGDDVYGYRNLMEIFEYLKYNDLVSSPCPAFYWDSNGKYSIYNDYTKYKTNITVGLSPIFLKRAFTIAGCLVEAPSMAFKRNLLSEEVLDFLKEYQLIEDQPIIYYFFKQKKIKMKYLDHAYILYRTNPDSISHTKDTAIRDTAKADLRRLCQYYIKHEKKLIYKYIAFLRKQVLDGRTWVSFLFPTNHYIVIMQKIFNKRIKKYYKNAIYQPAITFEKYLQMLNESAKHYNLEKS